MKTFIIILIVAAASLYTHPAIAQKNVPNEYLDYQEYFQQAFMSFGPDKKNNVPRPFKEIQKEAASLKDDIPLREGIISTLNSKTKRMDDEAVFSKSRNSVFIIGKLYRKPGDTTISFSLMATAFAVAPDGFCVTNYHVLQDIIRGDKNNGDSVYFIITTDRKVYLLNTILAYSQNNDLAIFKVNTLGDKLSPLPFGKYVSAGAAAYCISHPDNHFYYFSKGMVARNVTSDPSMVTTGYNPNGKPPIRMEISTDYGLGSSGGPILDKYGNLIGVVSSTNTVRDLNNQTQMVVKNAIPVIALKELLGK